MRSVDSYALEFKTDDSVEVQVDPIGQDKTWQGRAGHSRAQQGRVGQGRAMQGRTVHEPGTGFYLKKLLQT